LTVPEKTLLEKYGSEAAAFSLRCVNRSYVGPIINLDAATLTPSNNDIYLNSSGEINTDRIEALCTNPDTTTSYGYCKKWYDQSGQGLDATASTSNNAEKPLIFDKNSGSVYLSNGKPALFFNDNNVDMTTGSIPSNKGTSYVVFEPEIASPQSQGYMFAKGGGGGSWYLTAFNGPSNAAMLPAEGTVSVNSATDIDPATGRVDLYSATAAKVSLVVVDEYLQTSGEPWIISGYSDYSFDIEGYVQEWVWWKDSLTSSIPSIEESVNAHYLIYQEATASPASGFLADYSGAAAAYSVRQLGDANLCMKVRRSGDSATKNIGFGSDGFVDTTAISDFCGTDDGFVVTWYDQSGNAVDATQATAGSQPKIYDGTDGIVFLNGFPAVEFDGSNDILQSSTQDINAQAIIAVASTSSELTSAQHIIRFSASYIRFDGTNKIEYRNNVNLRDAGFTDYAELTEDAATLVSWYTKGTSENDGSASWRRYANGELLATITGDNLSSESATVKIGAQGSSQEPLNGKVCEAIIIDKLDAHYDEADVIHEEINDAFNIYPDADTTPESGFLSEFSGAAAAYSVRKLGDSPVCMRVRKTVSAVDYYQVIGFDSNGDLDTAAIEEFGGTADVFVQTWYDQSGNGKHATQDTNAAQPKIYDGTNGVEKENGYPTINFDGTDDYLEVDGYIVELSQNSASVFALSNVGTSDASDYLLSEGDAESPYSSNFILGGGGDVTPRPVVWVNGTGFGTQTTGQNLIGFDYDGTNFQAYVDGAASGSSGSATVNAEISGGNTVIGSRASGDTDFYSGNLQELITYKSDKSSSRSDIEDNINNYYLIYQSASTTPATGLLAAHPAEAAYSVRQLGDALLCMKVASGASGNPTKNIGFKNGVLDTAAIEEFCGNNDGFVATWYDQSGNAVDASQSTHSRRPKIYDNATGILKENNKPCVRQVDGTSQLQFGLAGNANQHYFGVVTSDVNNFLFTNDLASDQRFYLAATDANSASASNNVTADDFYLNGTLSNGADDSRDSVYDAFINTQRLFSQKIDNSSWSSTQVFGYQFSSTYRMMDMQEVVIYNSDQSASRSSIETNINNHYKIYTPFIAGLLDSYPGAAAAYSLRRLSSTYTGPAIEITSTSGTQDIGFDSEGNLNTSDIIAFCGANDGTVSKWYDQSGNGNDAVQATLAQQPKIYDATTGLVTENGEPAVEFDGSNDCFTMDLISDSTEVSICAVHKNAHRADYDPIIGVGDGDGYALTTQNNKYNLFYRTVADQTTTSDAPNNTQAIVFAYTKSATSQVLYSNGTEIQNITPATMLTPTTGSSIGAYDVGDSATKYDGFIQEIVLYNSDQSDNRSGIEKNINKHYSIYNQPLLDVVPDAAAAYSLRKLRAGYTGPAINVFNGTDYKDIYFKSDGTLDTGAISRFCGSNDGTVAIWYDQSGNNNHANQTTSANRPKIYDSVTGIHTVETDPAIEWLTSDSLSISPTGSVTTFAVVKVNTIDVINYLLFEDHEVGGLVLSGTFSGVDGLGVVQINPSLVASTITGEDTSRHLGVWNYSGSQYQVAKDGGSFTDLSNTNKFSFTSIGRQIEVSARLLGSVQEIVLYNSDQSSNRNVVETNINHYYSIY
jgi:hypothetical protein